MVPWGWGLIESWWCPHKRKKSGHRTEICKGKITGECCSDHSQFAQSFLFLLFLGEVFVWLCLHKYMFYYCLPVSLLHVQNIFTHLISGSDHLYVHLRISIISNTSVTRVSRIEPRPQDTENLFGYLITIFTTLKD